jgi:hypothetical protein
MPAGANRASVWGDRRMSDPGTERVLNEVHAGSRTANAHPVLCLLPAVVLPTGKPRHGCFLKLRTGALLLVVRLSGVLDDRHRVTYGWTSCSG